MKKKPLQHYVARADVAKALSHPSRLMILDALNEGDLCVCDLTELVGSDQSTVSKHLAVLRNAGIIDMRKEGTLSMCHLRVQCLQGFWSCIEAVLRQNLEEQKGAVGTRGRRSS